MLKNHPKGLLAASLANMGERFGFYIMMAILTLFLMSKFGFSEEKAGFIYSCFYFSIYILALVGGIIADKTKNFKGTILVGIIMMAIGYAVIAMPTKTPVTNFPLTFGLTLFGLFIIAFGNGLFKGNLQALVGQMYDNEKYGKMRDSGFSLFYMFINVGAIFAPFCAVQIRNWWLNLNGFIYDPKLPELSHKFLRGEMQGSDIQKYTEMAQTTIKDGAPITDITTFSNDYLNVFNTGFHYAFAIAIIAMLISLIVYIVNKKRFPDPTTKVVASSKEAKEAIQMDAKEIKQRLYALFAVFGVVIFFWFSFHQNGLTLTFFAKDYTLLKIGDWSFSAELFQSVNPFFVVFLTPVVLAVFGWLRARGKEPSAPRKIAIGMGIAAFAFLIMTIGSYGLPSASELGNSPLSDSQKVTPLLLFGTYFILTIAELFISPLGLSFVSKVAPPKYQGIMQGCWLTATALGNQLLFIGAVLYKSIPVWATWAVFVGACLISMFAMLFMVKWIERITK